MNLNDSYCRLFYSWTLSNILLLLRHSETERERKNIGAEGPIRAAPLSLNMRGQQVLIPELWRGPAPSPKQKQKKDDQRLCSLEEEDNNDELAVIWWSVRLPLSTVCPSLAVTHGLRRICSRVGRSDGSWLRHQPINCWHSTTDTRGDESQQEITLQHPGPFSVVSKTLRLTCGQFPSEVDLSSQDLLVLFKGDVPTHHVVQQHAKRPHCGWAAVVPTEPDPLWGTVNPRTWREGKLRASVISSKCKCCSHHNNRIVQVKYVSECWWWGNTTSRKCWQITITTTAHTAAGHKGSSWRVTFCDVLL